VVVEDVLVSGSTTARSGAPSNSSSGWAITYWSQLVLARDEHDSGVVRAATRPPRALERVHLRPRVAVEEDGVEAADVDAEFECVRAPDAAQVAVVEPRFEVASPVVRE